MEIRRINVYCILYIVHCTYSRTSHRSVLTYNTQCLSAESPQYRTYSLHSFGTGHLPPWRSGTMTSRRGSHQSPPPSGRRNGCCCGGCCSDCFVGSSWLSCFICFVLLFVFVCLAVNLILCVVAVCNSCVYRLYLITNFLIVCAPWFQPLKWKQEKKMCELATCSYVNLQSRRSSSSWYFAILFFHDCQYCISFNEWKLFKNRKLNIFVSQLYQQKWSKTRRTTWSQSQSTNPTTIT